MTSSQIIKEAERILVKLKTKPVDPNNSKVSTGYIKEFNSILKKVVKLKDQQEELQTELLMISFDLKFQIEEIIKRIDEIEGGLMKDKKDHESFEKTYGFI